MNIFKTLCFLLLTSFVLSNDDSDHLCVHGKLGDLGEVPSIIDFEPDSSRFLAEIKGIFNKTFVIIIKNEQDKDFFLLKQSQLE